MKIFDLFVFLCITPVFAQFPSLAWVEILDKKGTSSISSGTYWEFNNLLSQGYRMDPSIDIASYPDLRIPGLSSGAPAISGGPWDLCGSVVTSPTQFLESNRGVDIKGISFLGSFGGGSLSPDHFGPGSFLFESVFFHEDYCYQGGREYGFYYDPYAEGVPDGNMVWAYWGTNENQDLQAQVNEVLGQFTDRVYTFQIYPTGNSSSCAFQVSVLDSTRTSVFDQSFPVNSLIVDADPGFCGAVTTGHTGYVSATVLYGPEITEIPESINLHLQKMFVGKAQPKRKITQK